MNTDQKCSCHRILKHFGLDAQTDKAIEEVGELETALRYETKDDIIGEIADVEIMLEQLKEGMNIRSEVNRAINYKIERTNRRIGEKYYE